MMQMLGLKRKNSDKKVKVDYAGLSDAELDAVMVKIAQQTNIKEDELLKFTREVKLQLAQNHKNAGSDDEAILRMINHLADYLNGQDVDLQAELYEIRSLLRNCGINDIVYFVKHRAVQYLCQIIDKMVFFVKSEMSGQSSVENLVRYVMIMNDSMFCLRKIGGSKQVVREIMEVKVYAVMVNCLWIYSEMSKIQKLSDLIESGRLENLQLLSMINMYDYTDAATLVLSAFNQAATQYGKHRFQCVIDCFNSDSINIMSASINFIMTTLSNVADGPHDWQERVLLRNEFLQLGLMKHLTRLKEIASEKKDLNVGLKAFEELETRDNQKLLQAFKDKQNDLSTWEGCVEALRDSESDAIPILQTLALVCDNVRSKTLYFSYAEHMLRHCLFGGGEDASFPHSLIYGLQADEAIVRSEEDSYIKNLLHKLRETNRIKEESLTKCCQYQSKLSEYKQEAEKLRAHISNPTTNPVPPVTSCDLPILPPQPSASLALPPVTGGPKGPPPPPGPPPFLKASGGPPAPPPPPPNLLKGGPPAPPPPPPNLLKGGPPPPPPPGLLKGGPAPPPIGGGVFMPPLPLFLREKQQIKAPHPLKKLHWRDNTIPIINILESSLWAKIDEKDVNKKAVVKRIDEGFRNEGPRLSSRCNSLESLNQVSTKKVKKAMIIGDSQLVQNAAIVFSPFKLSYNDWTEAVLKVDTKIFTASSIERLLAIFPNPDIMKRLAECSKDEVADMVEGERYLYTFASIKGIIPRLKAIMLKSNWKERVGVIKRDIATIKTGLDDIYSSDCFKTLLNLVLFVGNYMNRSSTQNSDAYAFKLQLLTKLSDVKGVDQNLLQTLADLMVSHFKGEKLGGEVFNIHQAQKIDLKMVRSLFTELSSQSKMASDYIEKYQPINKFDKFQEVMPEFLPMMKRDISDINSMFENLDKTWSKVQEYFATQKLNYPMSDFFNDMVMFYNGYEESLKELKKKRAKPKAVERKPLQPIQVPSEEKHVCSDSSDMDDFLKNMEKGIYRAKTPRSESKPSSSKVDKTLKKLDAVKQRENVGVRVRRVGQPTLIVGPTKNSLKSDASDENSDVPDTASLLEQLQAL